ncbi:Protein-tyrosine phosphatase [Dictyocaulus viviparus]|uniref:Protein-tyrosine phosphatase n=1 Tax=Dictyocaulus viviparus TaxID=29172 RepID=A0A0D8Y8V7_DICVI|nr:Protein-tyrosine phosphatase [Dictyocaulus viviparus]
MFKTLEILWNICIIRSFVGHHSDKSVCDKSQKWRMYMEKTMESGTDGMQLDFRIIRGYLPPAATRTAFDANMEKNRFEDVVCIDQSRVRLSNGNYIHASWVNIGVNKKAILTQLPVRESIAEFWLMILEMDVEGILLILTHSEFNMFNANWVFPAEQDFLHFKGVHIRVGEFKRVTIDREWTMHVISVRSGDCKRYVHMHHYSGWTHGKQPIRILDLWQIQSTFRKYRSPHVYMSLSGCGRAGTYAAFEIAHERLHWDGCNKLNINECIYRARNGRMHAVQRPIQLQTIHACIMEHIMATKFASQLPQRTVGKYEEFSSRFNKCAELQEDMA